MAQKETRQSTFVLTRKDGSLIKVECFTKKGARGFTHFAEAEGKRSYIAYLNRTWESFEYESVLLKLCDKLAVDKDDKKALNASIKRVSDEHKAEVDRWFEQYKKDYDGLSDTTKKHLANACPIITSVEQADNIMKASKAFDMLFRLDEGGKQ